MRVNGDAQAWAELTEVRICHDVWEDAAPLVHLVGQEPTVSCCAGEEESPACCPAYSAREVANLVQRL